MAVQFASYPQLTLEERQHLVAATRRYLYASGQKARSVENLPEDGISANQEKSTQNSRLPKTTKVIQPKSSEINRRIAPSLDQPLSGLVEVGVRRGGYLARLGLHTVRDMLFYYPRDHIDYARQVNICELEAGETVTLVGTVKRCQCFSSPRNSKLTILELAIKDNTGQIRINRFFAGHRFSHRGWQEQQKRKYPVGAVVATSGLVKESKYGLTLEDPEVEVLAHPGDPIDSLTIGRVVPIYALTDGVGADMVRQAIIAALPATAHLKDPLPSTLRDRYGLMELSQAIANIHFPPDSAALDVARRRLVFDEFFYLQLGLLQRQHKARETETSAVLTLSLIHI